LLCPYINPFTDSWRIRRAVVNRWFGGGQRSRQALAYALALEAISSSAQSQTRISGHLGVSATAFRRRARRCNWFRLLPVTLRATGGGGGWRAKLATSARLVFHAHTFGGGSAEVKKIFHLETFADCCGCGLATS